MIQEEWRTHGTPLDACTTYLTPFDYFSSRRMFTKLVLFTFFLLYPLVSRTVLSIFVCTTVQDANQENQTYLVEDFTIHCYDHRWYSYLGVDILMVTQCLLASFSPRTFVLSVVDIPNRRTGCFLDASS